MARKLSAGGQDYFYRYDPLPSPALEAQKRLMGGQGRAESAREGRRKIETIPEIPQRSYRKYRKAKMYPPLKRMPSK